MVRSTSDEFSTFIRNERAKYAKVIKDAISGSTEDPRELPKGQEPPCRAEMTFSK